MVQSMVDGYTSLVEDPGSISIFTCHWVGKMWTFVTQISDFPAGKTFESMICHFPKVGYVSSTEDIYMIWVPPGPVRVEKPGCHFIFGSGIPFFTFSCHWVGITSLRYTTFSDWTWRLFPVASLVSSQDSWVARVAGWWFRNKMCFGGSGAMLVLGCVPSIIFLTWSSPDLQQYKHFRYQDHVFISS